MLHLQDGITAIVVVKTQLTLLMQDLKPHYYYKQQQTALTEEITRLCIPKPQIIHALKVHFSIVNFGFCFNLLLLIFCI